MGKLNPKFELKPSDFYRTPASALPPLLPFLQPKTSYCEPAAGDGALIDLLAGHSFRCAAAFDVEPKRADIVCRDALTLVDCDLGDAETFIANLPWSFPIFPRLVRHLITLRPLWTIAPARWAHAERAAELVARCSHIVCMPRPKWFANTPHTYKQDVVWLHFDARHSDGPRFYPRRETR